MNDLDPQDCEHYVVFYTDSDDIICIYHMVGFEDFPDEHNINMIIKELKTDDELGMKELVKLCNIKIIDKALAMNIMDEEFDTWE